MNLTSSLLSLFLLLPLVVVADVATTVNNTTRSVEAEADNFWNTDLAEEAVCPSDFVVVEYNAGNLEQEEEEDASTRHQRRRHLRSLVTETQTSSLPVSSVVQPVKIIRQGDSYVEYTIQNTTWFHNTDGGLPPSPPDQIFTTSMDFGPQQSSCTTNEGIEMSSPTETMKATCFSTSSSPSSKIAIIRTHARYFYDSEAGTGSGNGIDIPTYCNDPYNATSPSQYYVVEYVFEVKCSPSCDDPEEYVEPPKPKEPTMSPTRNNDVICPSAFNDESSQATTISVTTPGTNPVPKVFGVNYGSIFVPEDWSLATDRTEFYEGCVAFSPDANQDLGRLCLTTLPEDKFEERYLARLDKYINDEDFAKMAAMGVNVLRVPCGYWNWVTYPGSSTPNGFFTEKMAVLQTLHPDVYRPYFDRIFNSAKKHGIKVLLDLHGLPGSQNGEMHSGHQVEHPQFNTEWNKWKAVEAVENMANYVMDSSVKEGRLDTLYGIQVINEPNHYVDDPREFLDQYYEEAIAAARKAGLPKEVPMIVFEWTYNMWKWEDDRFDYETYGNVMWDTHVYHTYMEWVDGTPITDPSVEDQEKKYWRDLCDIDTMHRRQSGGVVVGEWSLAGPAWDKEKNQIFVKWIVRQFMERSHGSIFWTWEADIPEWSFTKSETAFEFSWLSIFTVAIASAVAKEAAPAQTTSTRPKIYFHDQIMKPKRI